MSKLRIADVLTRKRERPQLNMAFFRKALPWVVIVVLTCVLIPHAHAQAVPQTVPRRINYQGILTDAVTGQPRTGTYSIIVRIYEAETGGSDIFEERHDNVLLTERDNGVFNIEIGSEETLSLDFNTPYWLSIEVIDSGGNSDGELVPRQRIVSSPYSINSDMLDGIEGWQFLRSDEDDIMFGNLTITGSVNVLGAITGTMLDIDNGVESDTFTIDKPQDSPNIIALIFGDLNNERLYYSLLEDTFHLSDGLSIGGSLTVSDRAIIDQGIDINNGRFTVSSIGDVHADGSLDIDGDATIDGNVDLGDELTDTISFLGSVDTDLTFSGVNTITTTAGDLILDATGDIRLGTGASDTIVSNDLTVSGGRIYSLTALAITFFNDGMQVEGDLTVSGGDLYTADSVTINPVQGGAGLLQLGGTGENDSVFIDGDLTISGNLSIAGSLPALDLIGTSADSFTIDYYDSSDTPTLIFRDSDVDETLIWNDVISMFELSDELSLSGSLTVGEDIFVYGTGISRFTDGRLYIGSTDPSSLAQQAGDLYVGGDVEILQDLSVGGAVSLSGTIASVDGLGILIDEDLTVKGTLFVDDILPDDQITLTIGDGSHFIAVDSVDWDISVDGDMSNIGAITADGSLYLTDTNASPAMSVSGSAELGDSSADTLAVRGTAIFGDTEVVTITDAGDLTTSGSVQLGDDTGDVFSLTSSGLTITTDGTIRDTADALLIDDDVSITGELSVGDDLEIFGTGRTWIRNGRLYIGDDVSASGLVTGTGDLYVENDVEIGGSLSVAEDVTVGGALFGGTAGMTIYGDLTITDTLFVDRIDDEVNLGITIVSDTTMQSDVSIEGNALYSPGDMLINPVQGGPGILALGETGEGDQVRVEGNMTISDSLTVGGTIFGTASISGTTYDSFTIDSDDTTDRPTLGFRDSDGDEYLRWNDDINAIAPDGIHSFELSDDLSLGGDLTVQERLFVEGAGARTIFSGAGHTLEISDGHIEILESGGGFTPSSGFQDAGDLVVEDDVEIGGDASIGGDLTIAGVIFSGDFVRIGGNLTVDGDVDIRGRVYDGIGPEIDILDDLSVSGDLTVWGADIYVGAQVSDGALRFSGDTEQILWDESEDRFSLSDDFYSTDTFVFGGTAASSPGYNVIASSAVIGGSTVMDSSNDLFIEGDVEVGGDLSLGGDVSIAGVIFSDDYTQIMGPLTVMGDLDVRGNIYDGAGPEVDVLDNLSIAGDLSVWGSDLFIGSTGGADDRIYFSGGTEQILWDESGNQFYLTDDLYVSGALTTTGGAVIGDDPADTFTVTSRGLNISQDGTIFDRDSAVEVLDDLSVSGDLTVLGNTRIGDSPTDSFLLISSGLNVALDGTIGDTDSAVRIDDDLSVTGEVSIGGDLTVQGTGISRFSQGRVYIGSTNPSILAQQSGDLYVESDVEIGGDLSVGQSATIGGDLSVAGEIKDPNLPGTTSDIFTIDLNDTSDTPTLAFRDSDGDETLLWNDVISSLEMSDDVSMGGALTVAEDALILGAGLSRFQNGRLYIGTDDPSAIAQQSGDLYVQNDVEIGGDLSLGGDGTIIGVIFSDDYTYIVGPLTVGDDLDVRGRIFDGAGIEVDVADDLSISGDLTVWGSDIYLGLSDGTDDRIRFSGDQEYFMWDDTNNYFELSSDMSIGANVTVEGRNIYLGLTSQISDDNSYYTQISPQNDHLVVRDGTSDQYFLVYDSTGNEYVSLDMSQNPDARLLVSGGDLFIQTQDDQDDYIYFTMDGNEPYLGTAGGAGFRIDTDGDEVHIADGDSLYVDVDTLYVDATADRVGVGTTAVTHTLEVAGTAHVSDDLTVGGGDIDLGTGTGTIHFDDDSEQFLWDNTLDEFRLTDDLSVSGRITVAGVLRVGHSEGAVNYNVIDDDANIQGTPGLMNAPNDLYVAGDVEVGGDLSLGKDVTIAGVIFGDDYTEVVGPLTASDDIDVRGRIYDGVGPEVDILDDLSVSGDLTVWGSDIYIGSADSDDDILRFSGDQEYFMWDDTNNYFELSSDMSIGANVTVEGGNIYLGLTSQISDDNSYYTQISPQNDHLVVRDGTSDQFFLVYDSTGNEYVSLDMSQNPDARLLVSGGDLFVQTQDDQDDYIYFTMDGSEPYLGTAGGAGFRIDTDGDEVYIADGDSLYVDVDTLFVDATGDRVVVGATAGTHTFEVIGTGRFSDDLTVSGSDVDLGTGTGTLHFDDDSERFLWENTADEFQLTDDLSVAGDLTVWGSTRLGDAPTDAFILVSSGLNVAQDGTITDTDSAVHIVDDLSVTGEVSVGGDLTVQGTGISRFSQGRVYIGSTDPSTIAQQSGDMYVEGDVEVGGDVSLGGDITIVGVIFSDDYTQVMGPLTVADDLDVRGRIFDGVGPEVDIFDDLSISGDLTAWGRDIYVGYANQDGYLRFRTNAEQIFWDESDSEFEITDDMYMSGSLTAIDGALIGSDSGDIFAVTSSGLNVALDGALFDEDSEVEVRDSLSISGGLTVGRTIRIGNVGGAVGFNAIDLDSVIQATTTLMDNVNDLYVEGDMEVGGDLSLGGDVTLAGIIFTYDYTEVVGSLTVSEDLDVRGRVYDGVGDELDVLDDLSVTGDLTVWGSDVYLISQAGQSEIVGDPDLTVNPTQGGSGVLTLGVAGESDEVYIWGDTTISGMLTVSGDVTVGGIIHGATTVDGTTSDTFTIDTDDSTDTPTLGFFDSDGTEYLRWNDELNAAVQDGIYSFELSDDLSLGGDLTVMRRLRVEASSGRSYFSGAGHTVEISDGNLEIYEAAMGFTPTSGFDDEGDLVVGDDVEIGGDLSIGGDVTIIGVIFSDDYTEIIGDLTVNEDVDVRGNIYDGVGVEVDVADDLSIAGDLTVWGADIYVGYANDDGRLRFSSNTEQIFWDESGSEFEFTDDLYIDGVLTTTGGALIGDDPADIFTVQSSGLHVAQDGGIDDTDSAVEVRDSLSVSGALTISRTLRIGNAAGAVSYNAIDDDANVQGTAGLMNARNDLYVEGDVEIGGDLSIGGDVTIVGVIFSDDYTEIVGPLTVGDDIDVRGRIFDGAGIEVDVADDLSISGDLTVWGSDIYLGLSDGTDDRLRFSGDQEYFMWDDTNNYFELSSDVSIGANVTVEGGNIYLGLTSQISDDNSYYTQISPQNDHLVVRDGTSDQYFLVYDSTGNEYVSLDMSQNPDARLLVSGGDLFIQTQDDQDDYIYFTMDGNEPYLGTAGGAGFRIDTDGDEVHIADGDSLYVDVDTLYVDATTDRVGVGTTAVTHTLEVAGTAHVSDDLTVGGGDIDLGTGTGTLHFDDDSEQFLWNNTLDEFQLTDDLSIAGDLSVFGSTRLGDAPTDTFILISSGLNIAENGTITDTDTAVRMYDDVSITGELSVNDELTVLGTGISRFENGRVYVGSTNPSTIAQQSGDLYVEEDTEILRDLSVGGDITVAGNLSVTGEILVTEIDGTTSDTFTIDMNDASDTPTLGFRDSDGDEYFRWNDDFNATVQDGIDSFELSDDLSIGGSVSVEFEMLILGSGVSRFRNGRVYIGDDDPSTIAQQSGDLYVQNDLEVGGDLSIGGDITIIGVIFSDDYTQVIGPLTASDDLDVRGRIYDGAGVEIDILDDLSVSGDLTVWGADIYVGNANADGRLRFRSDSEEILWDEAGNEFEMTDDLYVDGALTTTGGAEIGNDAADIFIVQSSGLNIAQDGGITDTDSAVEVRDSLSASGALTVSRTLRIGNAAGSVPYNAIDDDANVQGTAGLMDGRNDLYVAGDVEVGGDLSLGGDVTIIGVIFSDDYTEIIGSLTVGDDIDVRGRIYDGAAIEVDIDDDLSVSGSATIDGALFVADDTVANDSDGLLNLGRNNAAWEYFWWDDSEDRFRLSDDLILEETAVSRLILDDGTSRGQISYDDEEYGFHLDSNVSISNNLTVMEGYVSSGSSMTLNPVIGSGSIITLGGSGEGDSVHVDGDMTVEGYLTVAGDLTVSGTIYGESGISGTVEDVFTIDIDDTTDRPTLGFRDSDGDEYLRWNDDVNAISPDGIDSFELSDDLSIQGDLTIERRLRVEAAGGRSYFSGADHGVEISDGRLEIYESGGTYAPSFGFQDRGDLAVGDDVEIGGDMSVGGDVTIAGVIFTGDYMRISGNLTVDEDIDVRGRIYDGIGPEVDILDDLSVSGVLNVDGVGENDIEGFINLGTATSAVNQGDLAMSGELTLGGNRMTFGSGSFISDQDANFTQISPQNSRLELRDDATDQYFLVYDSTGNEYVSLDMSQNPDARLLVSGGDLFIQTQDDQDDYLYFTTVSDEPYISTAGSAGLRIDTDGNAVHIVDGETLYVDTDTLYVDAVDDRVGINTTAETHTLEVVGTGRVSDDFTVSGNDLDLGSGSGTVHFGAGQEQFGWDNARDEFQLTDDLSLTGRMTISEVLRIGSDQGAVVFNAIDTDGIITATTWVMDAANDLYVEGDIESHGSITLAGDLTIYGNLSVAGGIGVANLSGTSAPSFTIDVNDTTDRPTLFFTDTDGNEYFRWNDDFNPDVADGIDSFELSDDLSIAGSLTIWEELIVNGSDVSRFSAGRVYIASDDPSNFAQQAGDLYVENDVEIGGDLSIGGDVTIIGVVFSDDYTEIIGDLTVGDDLDVRGRIYDGAGAAVDILDDLSISGDLSVWGSDIFIGRDDSLNDQLRFSGDTETLIWHEGENEFRFSDDLALTGGLTAAGTLRVGNAVGAVSYNVIDADATIQGTPGLMNDRNDLYIAGDVEVGGNLSLGGDVSIRGVIFSDDYTEIIGSLTVGDDIDVRGNIYDGAGVAVDIDDDLSIAGDLTVWGSDIFIGSADGDDDRLRFSGDQEYFMWQDTDDFFEASDDLSVGINVTVTGGNIYLSTSSRISDDDSDYTQISPKNDHLVVRDGVANQFFLVYDSTGNEYVSLDMSQNPDARLLVSNGDLFIQTQDDQDDYLYFTMVSDEPYISTAGSAGLRIDTDGDAVHIVDGETLYVDTDTLYVDAVDDRVGINTTAETHTLEVIGDGRVSLDLTVADSDVYLGTGTGTLHFDDDAEQFMWNTATDEFALTDDVSVSGDLTVLGSTRLGDTTGDTFILISSGLNIAQNGTIADTDSAVRIYDDVSITGELSINDDLTVRGSGLSRFENGRLYIGSTDPSTIAQQSGDMYVEEDVEVGGSVSVGGDLTVAGNLSISGEILPTEIRGTTADSFTIDTDDTTDTPTLAFEDSDGDETLLWNDTISSFEISDDLSIGGSLSIESEMLVLGSGVSRFRNGRVYIASDDPSSMAQQAGDLYVENDVEIGGNLSIGGDVTIIGVIFSDDYTEIIDSLTVGDDIDVRGRIYDGAGIEVDVDDDLSISGDLTVWSSDIYLGLSDSVDDMLRFSGDQEYFMWDDTNNYFEASSNLSLGDNITITGGNVFFGSELRLSDDDTDHTQFSPQNDHLVVRDGTSNQFFLVYDSTGNEYVSLDMSQNPNARLLVSNGDLFIQTQDDQDDYIYFTMVSNEPYLGTAGGAGFRIDTDGNQVHIADGESLYVDVDTLFVDGAGDQVGIGTTAVTHTLEVGGTARVSDDLTVSGGDIDLGTGTGTIHFDDDSEQLSWNNATTEFRVTDDLSVDGQVTVGGVLRVGHSAGAVAYSAIDSDANVQGTAGLMDSASDLYVEGDMEVGDDLSIGGNLTIAGVIFADDYTEIVGNVTVGGDLDVRGRIFDGAGIAVDVDDDLSVSGNTTIDGTLFVADNAIVNDSDGLLNLGRNSAAWEYFWWDDSQDQFRLSDDLLLEESAISTIIMDDGTSQGRLSYDDEEYGFHLNSNLSISDNLTVMEGYISSGSDMTINPIIGSGAVLELGGAGEGDTVLINGNTSITGYLTIAGDLTVNGIIYGQSAFSGTAEDSFTIDTDDSTDTPTLGFTDSDGNEYLRWNDDINTVGAPDGIHSFELSHDLSLGGDLTIEKRLRVEAAGGRSYFSGAGHTLEITDGHLEIYDSATSFSPTSGFADNGDLVVQNDVEIGGNLSIGGDVTIRGVIFSDDYTEIIGSLTVGDDIDVRGRIFDGAAAEVDILDNLSVSGEMNVDGVGENDIEGYINLGTATSAANRGDVAMSGELTLGGNRMTFGSGSFISDQDANFTQISPQNSRLELRDDASNQFFLVYDSTGNEYVSLDMSQNPDARLLVSNGDLFIQTQDDQDDYLYFTMVADEPYISTAGSAGLRIDSDGNTVHIVDGETLYVDTDTLYVDAVDDRVGINTTAETHTLEVIGDGRVSLDLTVADSDVYLGTGTGTLHFDDDSEEFRWDSADDEFVITDDVSVSGDLTVLGSTRLGDAPADSFILVSSGLNVAQNGTINDYDTAVRIYDDLSVVQSMSVNDTLTVRGSGLSRFTNGRVYIGADTPSTIAQDSGDLYVQNDMEIGGDLSVGGDFTIAGVIFSDDFTYFGTNLTIGNDLDVRGRIYDGDDDDLDILDDLSISGDLTVWGRDIYVGGTTDDGWIRFSNNTEQIFWDESDSEFEVSDDLNILGALTTTGGSYVGNDNTDVFIVVSSGLNIAADGSLSDFDSAIEVDDDLTISGNLTVDGGRIYGNGTYVDMGYTNTGVVEISNDLVITNDVTIGGNLSVAGTILGVEDRYVNTTGDTMTGTLIINTAGSTGLDVNGDIEYTGALRNQSPVKIADGLAITNLGGIKGGQILLKDVIIALDHNMSVVEREGDRTLVIPGLKFMRFTEKRPVIKEQEVVSTFNVNSGLIELPIGKDEHIIRVIEVNTPEAQAYFTTDVGLDGVIGKRGDYRVRGQRKIVFWQDTIDKVVTATIRMRIREDIAGPGIIELALEEQRLTIEKGWQIVFVREEPVDAISAHDTAAMSPVTKLVIGVAPINEFKYSADTYVIAVIMPDNKISQYIKVNKFKHD